MKLFIFATHNPHKVQEIRSLLPVETGLSVISLKEAGFFEDIPEPHDTLEANAREKSATTYRETGRDCFSEDTGLEVAALDGAPGVLSARYAGEGKSASDNIEKLLTELRGISERKARFRTVISLFQSGEEFQFEGICRGTITETVDGAEGFGYDPVFIPDGATKTFARMSLEEKNGYSHRAKAVGKLIDFLRKQK